MIKRSQRYDSAVTASQECRRAAEIAALSASAGQSAVGGTSQALRSTKSTRATTRMSPSMPPPMYMLIPQVVRLSGHWNIKRTKQSGRYRT